jgi:hypothetical protein
MVHVVSILEVMMRLGETVFQSKEVNGAVWSGVFEFDKRAKGVSFVMGEPADLLFIEFECVACGSEGRDQSLRWSPEVANKSVVCFCDDGGSHSKRVTGYECVASAIFVNSKLYLEDPGVYISGGVLTIWVSRICICDETC